MGKKLTRKVIDMLRELAEPSEKLTEDEDDDDEEGEEGEKEVVEKEAGEEEKKKQESMKQQYQELWKLYASNVKFGLIQDPANRSKLATLVRFFSTNDPNNQTSFKDYIK